MPPPSLAAATTLSPPPPPPPLRDEASSAAPTAPSPPPPTPPPPLLLLVLLVLLSATTSAVSAHGPKAAAGNSFDALPRSFWYELSSPFTEDFELTEPAPTPTPEPQPFFEGHLNATNVTTQFGSSVFLHCRVNDLRDRTVSWVRRRGEELHLLTVGTHTYAADERLRLALAPPNDWRLHIRFAGDRDAGAYECQVSAHPPLVHYVQLRVVVPKVEITGERGERIQDKFYKAGSTIELKCVVTQVPQPSAYVTWKHGTRMLNYDTSRGGISVKTDIQQGGATSRLYIANARRQDSGNYTCALGDAAAASVMVHVLNGENPAAMQHGGVGGQRGGESVGGRWLAAAAAAAACALWGR